MLRFGRFLGRFPLAHLRHHLIVALEVALAVRAALDDDKFAAVRCDCLCHLPQVFAPTAEQRAQLFFSWQDAEDMIENLPGATVARLGQQKIAGQPCHGLRFKADLARMVKAQGISALPGQPALTDLCGPWTGEIWISDSLGLPLKLVTRMIGMEYVWEITEVPDRDPADQPAKTASATPRKKT